MKVLKTHNFISERIKIRPVTNAEFGKIQQDIHKNPFGLTKKDLDRQMSKVPMGIAVRMLEEQEMQNNAADITIFCYNCCSDKDEGGFNWKNTEQGTDFWKDVLGYYNFDVFFDRYPEYEKYNLD